MILLTIHTLKWYQTINNKKTALMEAITKLDLEIVVTIVKKHTIQADAINRYNGC